MDLIALSRLPSFKLGSYEIVSQNPSALKGLDRDAIVSSWLPVFVYVWASVERVTRHRWRCTSYIRSSPSHMLGQSFDLAPDIDPSVQSEYAVFKGSDPVLYKRAPLIRYLQLLNDSSNQLGGIRSLPPYVGIGLFIESDHIHVQILKKDNDAQRFSIVKWGLAKPLYSDTFERKVLPYTNHSYNR